MSLLIVRGPTELGACIRGPAPLPREMLAQLVASAGRAGRVLSVRACGSEQELLDALYKAREGGVEALILDPGAARGSARLERALAPLRFACVRVDARARATTIEAGDGDPVRVQGYGMQGYVLALYLLLEHLGCAGWSETIHVGT